MYVYVDILIITNIYADFLLIKSTAAMTRSPLKLSRGIAAAVLGSLFSLTIFLPRLPPIALVIIKLFSAAPVVYAAFGFGSPAEYVKRLFIFFLMAFVYAGLGTTASGLFGGRLIVSRNGVVYGNLSLPVLIAASIAAYAAISIYRRAADITAEGTVYTVTVREGEKLVRFRAMADTGNVLRDMITGKPVILCSREDLKQLYGSVPAEEDFGEYGSSVALKTVPTAKWRLIPCTTVTGTALVPIRRPEEVCLKNEETGVIRTADVYLGASPCKSELAVFNPCILKM